MAALPCWGPRMVFTHCSGRIKSIKFGKKLKLIDILILEEDYLTFLVGEDVFATTVVTCLRYVKCDFKID